MPTTDAEMTQLLARIPPDVQVVLAAAIGPLRRERATAPLIERLLHVAEIAAVRRELPACAVALADRAERIVIGIPDSGSLESTVIVSGPWTRTEAATCAHGHAQIKIVGTHTIEVQASSPDERTGALAARRALFPAGSKLRVHVGIVLDRLSARAELTTPDERSAVAVEQQVRAQLGGGAFPGGMVLLTRTGSRVRLDVDAGPTMLRVIESSLP